MTVYMIVVVPMPLSRGVKMKKKYTKKDFLEYAQGFNYDLDSDDDIKKDMKSWSLKDFQEFYGFTHKEVE